MNDDDRTLAAYHEAGHAVIAKAFGIKVAKISLKTVTVDYVGKRGHSKTFWKFVALSGPMAEFLASDGQTPLAAFISPLDRTDLTAGYDHIDEELTKQLVEAYWPEIEALAQKLLRFGELDMTKPMTYDTL